jgi:hypothetical protein
MVSWYDPGQLIRTAFEVLVSTILGKHSDFRLTEALNPSDTAPFHHCDETLTDGDSCFWIDYIGDTGDGWDSTYTIAYYLAQPEIALRAEDGVESHLPRGNVLIFGGDQVYPTPSRSEYERRLVAPYTAALPPGGTESHDVFAIPGNHDWYDSLVSFKRLFMAKQRFAGWRARQDRSYFALKLPRGWWLLGTDVQLGSDIDAPQVEYFQSVAKHMLPEDRVILCNAQPHWIWAHIYSKYDPDYSERNLRYLQRDILPGRVAVFLAGDLHHYRRHAAPDARKRLPPAGGAHSFTRPMDPRCVRSRVDTT